jgi:hypothetical protein
MRTSWKPKNAEEYYMQRKNRMMRSLNLVFAAPQCLYPEKLLSQDGIAVLYLSKVGLLKTTKTKNIPTWHWASEMDRLAPI